MGDWTITIDGEWVAWLTFDQAGRSVNTFTAEAMGELEDAIAALDEDERIKAVAIRSGKPGRFIAGADINELANISTAEEAAAKAEYGTAVFDRIAALPVPTVAVIDGACMGGGLEMALACDYRLVTDDPATKLAAPEVKLGIIPGWGGTVRLPKLVGLPQALPLILTGKNVSPKKAYRIGLADGIVASDFIETQTRQFIDRVLSSKKRRAILKRRTRTRGRIDALISALPPLRAVVYRKARKDVASKTNGNYPAPLAAIDVVRATYTKSVADGLPIERAAFAELAVTPVSRNLLWLFQASKAVRKGDGETPDPARHAGVVGAGIMGAGIAWSLANAGIRTRMHDIDWDAVARGMSSVAKSCTALVQRRKMTPSEMSLTMHRVGGTTDFSGFAAADIVIEAVPEDLDLKLNVLRDIEARVSRDTIICSNTSSLPLDELARELEHPKRFVGLHFFNPVPRMPLVEVAPARKTSKHAVVAAAELVRRLGKTPILVGACPGFLVNRILLPYLVESAWMFEEGVAPQRLDTLMERFGMPMGPLALADEVGLDVGFKVAKVLEDAYGPRMRVAGALEKIASSGQWMGKKSGSGFYVYGGRRRRRRTVNRDVVAIAAEAREADGVRVRALDDETIVDRAILIMVNEAARCLEEGVVTDAAALDMAMVFGTGFAPFRGGLLRYADARGLDAVTSRLGELADAYGERFRPAPLLERLARGGATFHEGDAS